MLETSERNNSFWANYPWHGIVSGLLVSDSWRRSKGYKILRRRLRIPERKQINLASFSVTGNKESVLAIFLIVLRQGVRYVYPIKRREENAWSNFQNTERSGKLFWIVGDCPRGFSCLVWQNFDMFTFSKNSTNWKINVYFTNWERKMLKLSSECRRGMWSWN